jgi:hypothetical protein
MMFANFRTKVLVYLGKPNSSPQDRATEMPEKPGNSPAVNQWRNEPANSAQTDFFPWRYRLFSEIILGYCGFFLPLIDF